MPRFAVWYNYSSGKEVLNLNSEGIKTKFFSAVSDINPDLIYGCYQAETNDIILLDPQTLISQMDAVLPLIWDVQMQLDLVASPDYEMEKQDLKTSKQSLESCSPLLGNSGEQRLIKQQDQELQTAEISTNFYDYIALILALKNGQFSTKS
jgi:hypothetical protein